jgi:hypothetical protein
MDRVRCFQEPGKAERAALLACSSMSKSTLVIYLGLSPVVVNLVPTWEVDYITNDELEIMYKRVDYNLILLLV